MDFVPFVQDVINHQDFRLILDCVWAGGDFIAAEMFVMTQEITIFS